MKRNGIDQAIEESSAGPRFRDARAKRPVTLRSVGARDDANPTTRLREAWFDRTYERVRGFLDDMFR